MALRGEIRVPGDKSITHRAILFGSIANGLTRVQTNVLGRDNLATLRILKQLGVEIEAKLPSGLFKLAEEEGIEGVSLAQDEVCRIQLEGRGFDSLRQSGTPLYCGNSGTTARLLCGLLAGRPFLSRLKGDSSLSKRPFGRVTIPLSRMGAHFSGEFLPLEIIGGGLSAIDYKSPVASAQVKSAVLLAGLQARGQTSVEEPTLSRDHTERMLAAMGCELKIEKGPDGAVCVSVPESANRRELHAIDISIPGDFSAAAFFVVAASISEGSNLLIRNVGFNPSRIGLYSILKRMGARVQTENCRIVGGEDVADLLVESADLQGVEVSPQDVVQAIDEVPILSVAAAFAEGETCIRGASELRVKESDRISTMFALLSSFGVGVEEHKDGLTIYGSPRGKGFVRDPNLDSHELSWQKSKDHRINMCGAVMDYAVSGSFTLAEREIVETSFPNFTQEFRSVIS